MLQENATDHEEHLFSYFSRFSRVLRSPLYPLRNPRILMVKLKVNRINP